MNERLRLWDNRLEVGTHRTERDDKEPNLPNNFEFNCPNGKGKTELVAAQFYFGKTSEFVADVSEDELDYLVLENDEEYDENNEAVYRVIDGDYAKHYVCKCCQTDQAVEIWDNEKQKVVGELAADGTILYY